GLAVRRNRRQRRGDLRRDLRAARIRFLVREAQQLARRCVLHLPTVREVIESRIDEVKVRRQVHPQRAALGAVLAAAGRLARRRGRKPRADEQASTDRQRDDREPNPLIHWTPFVNRENRSFTGPTESTSS